MLPTQRYYRQAVREELDIVVSVGGILGLFMGASILSLFEFIYFVTIRVLSSSYDFTDEPSGDEETSEESEKEDEIEGAHGLERF